VARLRVEQGFLGEEVALLRQQLEVSRRELAQAVTDAADAESNLRELENQGGAVMMIQGIAQTHIPIISRRVMGRWRRERERRVPFEEQASTIIGLILYVFTKLKEANDQGRIASYRKHITIKRKTKTETEYHPRNLDAPYSPIPSIRSGNFTSRSFNLSITKKSSKKINRDTTYRFGNGGFGYAI